MIIGTHVVLTALDPSNAETVRSWVNDPEVNRYMLVGHVPLTLGQELAYYQSVESSDSAQVFEIHVAKDMRLIGHVGFDGLDLRHRHAELGIMIGDREHQGRGFGRDALVTALRFAFDTLGLHRVAIKARHDNERGLRLYRSVGFKEVGVEREVDYAEGRFHDVICFDLLEPEFREVHSTTREVPEDH